MRSPSDVTWRSWGLVRHRSIEPEVLALGGRLLEVLVRILPCWARFTLSRLTEDIVTLALKEKDSGIIIFDLPGQRPSRPGDFSVASHSVLTNCGQGMLVLSELNRPVRYPDGSRVGRRYIYHSLGREERGKKERKETVSNISYKRDCCRRFQGALRENPGNSMNRSYLSTRSLLFRFAR
jgi:hypothetical protein